MAPKIAIVFYSMYGHIKKLADAEAEGIKEAGGTVDFFQVPETLPAEVLSKMHAAPKDSSTPVADPKTLEQYDAFLFGIPTRYGNFPAQWKAKHNVRSVVPSLRRRGQRHGNLWAAIRG